MLDLFLTVVIAFVVLPLVARYYSRFVHWLGAVVVRLAPPKLGILLSKRLYRNDHDRARERDLITAARHAQERKAGIAHKGELQ